MEHQETVGTGREGTDGASASEVEEREVQAEVALHLAGFLKASKVWQPDVVAHIIWSSLVAHRRDAAMALQEQLNQHPGAIHAELNYLQEIEKSAVQLLEFAPEAGIEEGSGRNLVAEEAARIFSRVRLILPKEGEASHWEEDVDVSESDAPGAELAMSAEHPDRPL